MLCPMKISPNTGIFANTGISKRGRLAIPSNTTTPLFPNNLNESTTVRPEANRLAAKAVMNTFDFKCNVTVPRIAANNMEASTPRAIPTTMFPVKWVNTIDANAPMSMRPSNAMFNIPDSSVNNPPMAASNRGVMIATALCRTGIATGFIRSSSVPIRSSATPRW